MYFFEIGKIYSFNTMAPSVLGVRVTNATLEGIVDYRQACTMVNVDLLQRQVYPMLPHGTPNNTQKYIYYVFRTENGSRQVLASQWIEESTIQVVENITITITVPNASLSDVSRIQNAMNVMGFRGYTITV